MIELIEWKKSNGICFILKNENFKLLNTNQISNN